MMGDIPTGLTIKERLVRLETNQNWIGKSLLELRRKIEEQDKRSKAILASVISSLIGIIGLLLKLMIGGM